MGKVLGLAGATPADFHHFLLRIHPVVDFGVRVLFGDGHVDGRCCTRTRKDEGILQQLHHAQNLRRRHPGSDYILPDYFCGEHGGAFVRRAQGHRTSEQNLHADSLDSRPRAGGARAHAPGHRQRSRVHVEP